MNSHCCGQARKHIREILPKRAQQFILTGTRTNFIKWSVSLNEETETWLSEAG